MLDKYALYKQINPYFTGPSNLHELIEIERKFIGFHSMSDEDLSAYLKLIPIGRQPRRGDRITLNVHPHVDEPIFYWTGEQAVETPHPPAHFRAGEEFPFSYWGDTVIVPLHPDYLIQLQYMPCRVTDTYMYFLLVKPFGGSWKGVLFFDDDELVERSDERICKQANEKLTERILNGQYTAYTGVRMIEREIMDLPHADIYVVLKNVKP